MALILRELYRGYFTVFNDYADSRVQHLPFMSGILSPLAIILGYLYVVYDLGPKLMKNRKAFDLDKLLIVYNILQVAVNLSIAVVGTVILLDFNYSCQPIDYSPTPKNMFALYGVYVYFLVKVVDLVDTIFFIMRKKQDQVSFLHTYHHCVMIFIPWCGVKFWGGGQSLYLGICNCYVHAIMYFYYFLTIWKPKYKESIWWKKHITQIQLAQFLFNIITYGQLLFKPSCTYPKIISYLCVPQNSFLFLLFGDFYIRTYIKSPKKTPKENLKDTSKEKLKESLRRL